jgi:rhomboid family GlyGly-CTERM serine protease
VPPIQALRTPLLLYVLPAALAAALPGVHGTLLYARGPILGGELWRMWSGHWVHFSSSHVGWNLVVLVMAGTRLEQARPGLLLRYTLLAAPFISVSFLLFAPAMEYYGGLSGLATGTVTLFVLVNLAAGRRHRAWWLAALAVVAGKIALDATRPTPWFSSFPGAGIHSSALAHLAGALLAAVLFLSHRRGSCLPLSGCLPAGVAPSGQPSR